MQALFVGFFDTVMVPVGVSNDHPKCIIKPSVSVSLPQISSFGDFPKLIFLCIYALNPFRKCITDTVTSQLVHFQIRKCIMVKPSKYKGLKVIFIKMIHID